LKVDISLGIMYIISSFYLQIQTYKCSFKTNSFIQDVYFSIKDTHTTRMAYKLHYLYNLPQETAIIYLLLANAVQNWVPHYM